MVGVDDFHAEDEVQKFSNNEDLEATPSAALSIPDFSFIENQEDFNRVVSKLEIYIIKDPSIFTRDIIVNGVRTTFRHPDELQDLPNEKWIDLRGDKFIYLKVTYDNIKNCRKPFSDLNFYKISKYQQ